VIFRREETIPFPQIRLVLNCVRPYLVNNDDEDDDFGFIYVSLSLM